MTGARLTRGVQPRGADDGSALAIALVFLMVFGLIIGATLSFATTGERVGVQTRDEAASTYAGSGALDGAVNRLRTATTVGTVADGTSSCFTLPANGLDNPADVTVTCTPRTGSGVAAGGGSANTPDQAVRQVGGGAAQGVTLAGTATVPVQGAVSVDQTLVVPTGATLTSTGTIKAATCPTGAFGTVTPACSTQTALGDPGWPAPSTYPAVVNLGTVTCASPVMSLSPGTYLSKATLQAVLACTNTVVWFQPGLYYFDFQDAGATGGELVVGPGNVVVGGAALGWTPGTTAASAVPYPTAASPAASACDTAAGGVDLVFGGASRLTVQGGKMQLCAQSTSATAQHLVVHGLGANAAFPGQTGNATASASVDGGGTTAWTNPVKGAVIDATPASIGSFKNNDTASLTIGPFTDLVPAGATGITATLTVRETLQKNLMTQATLVYGGGAGTAPAVLLRDCGVTPCSTSGTFDPPAADSVSWTGKTPAQLNGASITVGVSNGGGAASVWVDGATLSVTYTANMTKTVAANKVLAVSGTAATTTLALHGTVYVPGSAVDLSQTGVPYIVIDRGLVARDLTLSMTPAAGYNGPLIAVPATSISPRQVLLVATTGGTELARTEVTLHNAAGTANGSVADLAAWFID
jgi:Tfp pilus assembly protein PilX